MTNTKKLLFLCLLGLLVGSCGTVFSPTLHLPHAPLQKNEGQITGAVSSLPSPNSFGVGLYNSGEGSISYGFSDRLTLQAKTWSDVGLFSDHTFNGGMSLGGMYLLNPHDPQIPIALIPTGLMLIKGSSVSAMGLMAQLAAWLPEFGIFRPYGGAGVGMLANDFKNKDWGYGGIFNAGVSAKLTESIYANLEFYGIMQYYYQVPNTITMYGAPSLSISWKFNNN